MGLNSCLWYQKSTFSKKTSVTLRRDIFCWILEETSQDSIHLFKVFITDALLCKGKDLAAGG